MNNRDHSPDLETVLDDFLVEVQDGDPAVLATWMREYPQFAHDLMEFAAARSLMARLPAAPGPQADEVALLAQGATIVDEILARQRSLGSGDASFPDLLAAAHEQGLSPRELATTLGLSVALVAKLQRRLLRASSIPRTLIEALARTLHCSAAAVTEYLGRAPTLAAGANYRSEQAPVFGAQQDFIEAVRSDPSIAPQDRDRWVTIAQMQTEE